MCKAPSRKGQAHEEAETQILTICADKHNICATFRQLCLLHVAERRGPARVAVTFVLMVANLPEIKLTVSHVVTVQQRSKAL